MPTCDPNSLALASRCFCSDEASQRAQVLFLLCKIFQNGGAGVCTFQEGAGSPVGSATPAFIGQLYHDTVADSYYRSTGLTSADWVAIAGGASGDLIWGPAPKSPMDSINGSADVFNTALNTLFNGSVFTELAFNQPTQVTNDVFFDLCVLLTGLTFNNLASIGKSFNSEDSTALIALVLSALTTVGQDFLIDGCTSLAILNASALTTVTGDFLAYDCTVLTTVLCGNWVPTDGATIRFDGDALNATSVELILRRCVIAGVTTCTIDLSGGINAGTASLSLQGQADVATLGAQVTMNP